MMSQVCPGLTDRTATEKTYFMFDFIEYYWKIIFAYCVFLMLLYVGLGLASTELLFVLKF